MSWMGPSPIQDAHSSVAAVLRLPLFGRRQSPRAEYLLSLMPNGIDPSLGGIERILDKGAQDADARALDFPEPPVLGRLHPHIFVQA